MKEEFKGLNLWQKVEMTNPNHTKDSSFGRKITAIDAYQQIKNFTEQFGPCGIGWGFNSVIVDAPHTACVVQLTLWIKDGGEFTEFGTCDWYQRSKKNPDGTFDLDAPKKANTDALTKAFSRVGFNADIFLGMFEDNRYVQHAAEEKNKEAAAKTIDAQNKKNLELIKGRFAPLKDAAAVVDMMEKMEKHFGPLYKLEVGQFFKNPYFSGPIIDKCKELGIEPTEVLGG